MRPIPVFWPALLKGSPVSNVRWTRMELPAGAWLLRMRSILLCWLLRRPHVPYISNVTGDWITPEQATRPDYWAEHMCQTVRFADGVRRLLAEQEAVLIEIGPGQSLTSFARQHPACTPERFARILPTLPLPYEAQGEQEYLLTALGKLWLVGAPISWQAFWQGEQRRRVILPTYPFERQRFWLASHQRQETM